MRDAGVMYQSCTIEGQQFQDVNGNRVHDAGEPGLDSWTIELCNQYSQVVGTQVTAGVDRNGDGQIDPVTESGRYHFDDLLPGPYRVEQVMPPGWRQSLPGRMVIGGLDVSRCGTDSLRDGSAVKGFRDLVAKVVFRRRRLLLLRR